VRTMAREAGRESVTAGFRVVENGDFGNAFGRDRILPRFGFRRRVPIH